MSEEREAAALRLSAFFGKRHWGYLGKWVGLASLIGFFGGLAAIAFDWLTHLLIDHGLRARVGVEGEGLGAIGPRAWLVLLVPTLGGAIVGWITTRFAPEAEGHGTEQLVRVFHNLGGAVRRRVIAVKAITSAITIGSGGSAGQEGPVAQIGSGIGSALADSLGLSTRDRRVFLLSGASAGIGALFTAPLGGALFAPEVLYRKPEFEGDAIVPSIIASIVAYTTFSFATGKSKAIPIAPEVVDRLSFHDPRELLLYLALALVCTLFGWIYVRSFEGTHSTFARMARLPKALRPALGGLLLGATALAIAPVAGDEGVLFGGYGLMRASIAGGLSVGVLALLVVAKIAATSFSIASGGSGGVFAPSLAIGALLGAIVGSIGAEQFPSLEIEPACFALVGMGGFFAGVAKVPIASIIIVCEMTGSYELLAPLMLVSVVHLVLARGWTIYNTQVDSIVDSPAHTGDFVVDVLAQMRVRDVVDDSQAPSLVSKNTTLRRALETVSRARDTYFPVVDDRERLVGIFSLTDIRRIFREEGIEDLVLVQDFMVDRVITVRPSDNLNEALRRMNEAGIHQLPVVAEDDERRVVTMLSRNNLGAAYHQRLRDLRRASES